MELDKEAAERSVFDWNKFSGKYENSFENFTIPSSFTLYSATKARYASKIVEVGVG